MIAFDRCLHGEAELRNMRCADGSYQSRYQCLRCGGAFGQAQRRNGEAPPPWDDALEDEYNEEWDRAIEDAQRKRQNDAAEESRNWKAIYSAYLQSEPWKARRVAVVARDRGVCQGCGASPRAEDTVVHHTSYARAGNELLCDLVTMCRDCHDIAHDRAPTTEWQRRLER